LVAASTNSWRSRWVARRMARSPLCAPPWHARTRTRASLPRAPPLPVQALLPTRRAPAARSLPTRGPLTPQVRSLLLDSLDPNLLSLITGVQHTPLKNVLPPPPPDEPDGTPRTRSTYQGPNAVWEARLPSNVRRPVREPYLSPPASPACRAAARRGAVSHDRAGIDCRAHRLPSASIARRFGARRGRVPTGVPRAQVPSDGADGAGPREHREVFVRLKYEIKEFVVPAAGVDRLSSEPGLRHQACVRRLAAT
jgi:hypothetical protein